MPVVLRPLIKIWALFCPGSPDLFRVVKPGNKPDNELERLATGAFFSIFSSVLAMAPVKVAFLCSPYPTTTTSSKSAVSPSRETSILLWLPIVISLVSIPTNEKTKVTAFSLTANE